MVNTRDLYAELLEAVGDKKKLFDAGNDVIQSAFESDAVEIEYKTTDTNLAVGEDVCDKTRFFTDTIQVQSLGAGAGMRVFVKGSYYDRVKRMDALSPMPNMSPSKGEVVTVNVELTLTMSKEMMEGDGVVLFTKGRN